MFFALVASVILGGFGSKNLLGVVAFSLEGTAFSLEGVTATVVVELFEGLVVLAATLARGGLVGGGVATLAGEGLGGGGALDGMGSLAGADFGLFAAGDVFFLPFAGRCQANEVVMSITTLVPLPAVKGDVTV